MGLFWWTVIGWLGGAFVQYNFSPAYTIYGRLAALALTLAFCLRRPTRSSFKTMMLATIDWLCGLTIAIAGGYIVIRLGYWIISCELKTSGIATLPVLSLTHSALYVVIAIATLVFLEFCRNRDVSHVARENHTPSTPDQGFPRDDTHHASDSYRYEERSPPPAGEPWWTTLQVDGNCSLEEAEAAARKGLQDYHPDRWMSLPPELRERAEEVTKNILNARDQMRRDRRQAA